MGDFHVTRTSIPGLFIIIPEVFEDNRGYFFELYNKKKLRVKGLDVNFVQINISKSSKGVIRGLHFQKLHPQGKLIKVLKGIAFDVAVDLRKGSPTYGEYESVILSEENQKMFYIPEGFAHGFLALTNEVQLLYLTTDYYCRKCDTGIIWNDPSINIDWPLEEYGISEPIISKKDNSLPLFEEEIPFKWKNENDL